MASMAEGPGREKKRRAGKITVGAEKNKVERKSAQEGAWKKSRKREKGRLEKRGREKESGMSRKEEIYL